MSGNLPLFNEDIWQEFGPVGGGSVKKLIQGDGADQKVAYFKDLSRRQGPVGANEYIVFKLGVALGLPVANIQLMKFGDTDGYLSLEIVSSNPWPLFPDKANSKPLLEDPSILAKLIVFDMWTRNCDRHGGNLVFQQRANKKYQLYMIDHEHCLYSAENGPPPSYEDFSNIIKIKEIAKQLTGLDELLSQSKVITDLGDDIITSAVDQFHVDAPSYLNETQANIIKDLLLKRKSILKKILTEWYDGGEWKT